MQSYIFGLSASKDRTLGACYFSINCIDPALLLLGEKTKTIHELIEGDSAGCALLNLTEGQVDICSSELLIEKLRVLGQLGESLTIHGILTGSTIVGKYFLKLFW